MKDPSQKSHFYRNTLKEMLPYIPKKLWFQHVWPCLQQEMKTQEVLAAVLQPIIFLVQETTLEEYETIILPYFRTVFSIPKSIQATVTLLENLHVILEKTPRDDIRSEVLPMLYNAFESATIQVQSSALVAVTHVSEYLDETAIKRMVLPKTKLVYEKNSTDIKIVLNVLLCLEKCLNRLDRTMIIDEVLPLLWDVRLQDPEIILRVVSIYRLMLSDKKYGLSVNLMATRVMPSLLPQTVNPSLNLDQFTILLEVLQEMLDHIDRNQRNKLKLDNLSLPSPERHRPLRHQMSSDNMHVPPFNIPNLRIEHRKTSSAEDMARKNSTGKLCLFVCLFVCLLRLFVYYDADGVIRVVVLFYLRTNIFFPFFFLLSSDSNYKSEFFFRFNCNVRMYYYYYYYYFIIVFFLRRTISYLDFF
ncbi:conserved hypothetical protein [Pediculus humanus corporis]|uniref:SCY1-like protein 2 n=1 Tax=Pediculus humanus subsp. corporis TaxID=121224 RepID=E0VT52_PEDHC|nr:uncharacterized protein Phum_PHUM427030 [Pediculus humanus corporis]EEB16558.1 conserved hypothetical protein [Pediculus humanus corporis]